MHSLHLRLLSLDRGGLDMLGEEVDASILSPKQRHGVSETAGRGGSTRENNGAALGGAFGVLGAVRGFGS